ncbi:MAG: hypothetical protein JWN60_1198 [Acidobacteria bacterium]|jgi:hypothetical protein|nr:hypothetical protein [Acidobacteriota bacterium]
MKLLLKIILAIAVIKTIVVGLLLIASIILRISNGGDGYILLPGLGLVISLSAIIFLLFAAEIFLILFVTLLRRYISKNRLQ